MVFKGSLTDVFPEWYIEIFRTVLFQFFILVFSNVLGPLRFCPMLKRLILHFRTNFFRWNLLIMVSLSPIAGHVIVTHGHKFNLAQWLKMPGYYFSIASSGLIALLLMFSIYLVSWELNRRFRENEQLRKWLAYQLCIGIGGVLILELLLATLLFLSQGYWILDTAFFRKLFVPIVMFIFVVNLCYMLFYAIRYPFKRHRVRYLPTIQEREITDDELEMPGLVFIDDVGIWALGVDGEKKPWLESLDATEKRFGNGVCFRGQRHWLVFGHAIAEHIRPAGRRTVILRLRMEPPFALETSRRSTPSFKRWFDGYLKSVKSREAPAKGD